MVLSLRRVRGVFNVPDTQVIQSRQSHSGFAEAALRLLEEARQLETHCRVDAAEAVFRAAVTCEDRKSVV